MSVMFDFKSVYSKTWKHLWDARVCKRMLAVAMAGLITGCSTIRYGGAPEPSFDVNKDLEQLATQFEPAASISDFYKKPSREARDNFITGRITMMNIRYIQFIRSLTSEKELLDTAVALLTLGLNLAGASVTGSSTKTVLAAVSAGVIGSKEAIDKNYFFDKTIPALVAQMNAERKKALFPLLSGIGTKTLDEYPFAQAVTDLNDYYFAGTFAGAIQGIQADAALKEAAADRKIETLAIITRAQVDKIAQLTDAIGKLVAPSDVAKIKKAITTLDKNAKPSDNLEAAKTQLQAFVLDLPVHPENIDKVVNAFKDAGISLE